MRRTDTRPTSDPTIYPVSDDMGTSAFELILRELLRPLVQRYVLSRGHRWFVGSDQFVYWQQYNPMKCVAPDLYLCPAFAPEARPPSIKVWELPEGKGIPFALEVVSEKKAKDYDFAPGRYDEFGVRELIIYDPRYEERRGGYRFQVYRKLKKGGFGGAKVTNEDRVFSKVLDCWLRVVDVDGWPVLRIGTGPDGDELFPTEEEALRSATEKERAAKEAERAAKEAERAAKEAAEARVRELEALLAAKRG